VGSWVKVIRDDRFRARAKEARKKPDDFRLPIAECRLNRTMLLLFNRKSEIGNRQ
jgi:hypothetical protein